MNEVYKKDADSGDGSVSPGLSQSEKSMRDEDASLVDIFI